MNNIHYDVLVSLRARSTVGCFLNFFQFPVEQVFVGMRKEFINNFVCPIPACASGFYNNNNNNVVEQHHQQFPKLNCVGNIT